MAAALQADAAEFDSLGEHQDMKEKNYTILSKKIGLYKGIPSLFVEAYITGIATVCMIVDLRDVRNKSFLPL